MCGLIGQASSEGTKHAWATRRDMFVSGLYHSAIRGDDSTGIAMVYRGKEKENAHVFKKAMSPADFIQLGAFDKLMGKFDEASFILGHTRAATMNKISHENAHPFQHGAITLTHNGHISNAHSLLKGANPSIGLVDSALFTQAMSLYGEKEALEAADGAFALAWHNTERGTLNFARNQGRELRFCFLENQDTMFWASERLMLVWLMEHHKLGIEGKFKTLDPGQWVEFNAKNLREYEVHSFSMRSRNTPVTGTGGDRTITKASDHSTTKNSTTDSGTTAKRPGWAMNEAIITGILSRVKVDEVLAATRRKEYQKSSGRPGKEKRRASVSKALAKLGVGFEQVVLGEARSWTPYTNQPKNGLVRIWPRGGSATGEMQNISHETFAKLAKYPYFLMRVIGFRRDKVTNTPIFLMERHELYPEFELERQTTVDKHRPPIIHLPDDTTKPKKASEHLFLGPGRKLVPLETYLEMVKHGCGGCSADISTLEDVDLLWVDRAPICKSCQDSEQIMMMIGIEAQEKRKVLN